MPGRMRWIKLWTQELLYGTTSHELNLAEQAIFFKLLAMAGDSPEPGQIEIAPGIPMSDEQIARVLGATTKLWLATKEKLQRPDIDKITVNEGIIHLRNFTKYQSTFDKTDYMRSYMEERRAGKKPKKRKSS